MNTDMTVRREYWIALLSLLGIIALLAFAVSSTAGLVSAGLLVSLTLIVFGARKIGRKRLSSTKAVLIYGFTVVTILLGLMFGYQVHQAHVVNAALDGLASQSSYTGTSDQIQDVSDKVSDLESKIDNLDLDISLRR